ncbi:MAG: alpha-amylase family glycosyl hydrolase [Pseudoflavonifractor sp.]|nr:alpha-amylase family glycosyl hydrolase [Pseudoflavonifractor sp.]
MRNLRNFLLGGTMALATLGSSAATFVGDRSDFRDETIYFAMTTRFYDGDPTNNVCSWDKQDVQKSKNDPDWRGDFKGLIDKLDYIKALGFTAIWITPIVQNASGEDYHGYHAMDFSNVDLRYESRKEWGASQDVKFQDLIDAAHAKGMKIVLDIVLQHTGNFGEAKLNPLFTRDQNIKNQASAATALIPNTERLSSNYFDQTPAAQYAERWKYFKQAQYEPNNYYHHYGTGWNWDEVNRWWGQIAGDCVDLNTENDYVAQYIVDCYGKFIEMGVDGFRIDTAGHISPLTFNTQFIPQFHAIANKPEVKAKRLNGIDFFMFGEVCQRFQGSVVYRDKPNLSSYFYTWKSSSSLMSEFKANSGADWWRQQNLNEGYDTPVGPMAVCEKDTQDKSRSNNVLMQNGQWHQPDYSQWSGFSVIDFPVHYSFRSVSETMGLYKQDNYYNDASYNVVYVDSHDYCPGPNDGTRFNGGTSQWAENLSWMFTFRGIPCIYYGSEVEFKKGLPIDVGGENNKTPRSESGRAYFGTYLEGDVTATDFGQYTASGNVQKTLNADLAQHIRRLNQIRAAVPALRKGQYTFDGCSANGGWAFKRAYKDSYALVAVNGGATFTNVPAGTYTDIVTGQTYNGGGTITVSAPQNQGQLRVLVKGWTGGKVGEDGKFIYASSPVSHGGNVEFSDPGASRYYTADDAVGNASVTFSPAGGTFKTDTQNVTVALNDVAVSGWYQIGNQAQVSIPAGSPKTFTIGAGVAYGETIKVNWGATGEDGKSYNGSVTYKKVDPNAVITVYVKGQGNMYAWGKDNGIDTEPCGAWPGKALSSMETVTVNGQTFSAFSFDGLESVSVIFNNNGAQTADITGITEDTYYEYDGGSTATKLNIDNPPTPSKPTVTANPASGKTFTESISVSLTANPAVAIYYTTDGTTPNESSAKYTSALTFTQTTTLKTFVKNDAGSNVQTFTYTKTETPEPVGDDHYVYFDGTFSNPQVWAWNDGGNCTTATAWPGDNMVKKGDLWYWAVPAGKSLPTQIIIHEGDNKIGGGDLNYVDKATYHQDGSNTPNGDIPDPVVPTNGYTIYFDNTTANWNDVKIYVYGNGNDDFLGAWAAVPSMTVDAETGYHKYHIDTDKDLSSSYLIFHNGNGSQTGDNVAIRDQGLYGLNGHIRDLNLSGIEGIAVTDGIKVSAQGGILYIESPADGHVTIVRADGSMTIRPVYSGVNVIDDLQRGFYIINRTKIIL